MLSQISVLSNRPSSNNLVNASTLNPFSFSVCSGDNKLFNSLFLLLIIDFLNC